MFTVAFATGRHAARLHAPNADALLMPVKTTVDADFAKGGGGGDYRVRFAARSSPAGVAVGALFTQYAQAMYRNPLN